MKYSHDYDKLDSEFYTTIRRYPKGKKGDVIEEVYPHGNHQAQIRMITRPTLDSLSLSVLIADTDLERRKEIYDLFQSFYKKPIDFVNERFYMYYLKKVYQ